MRGGAWDPAVEITMIFCGEPTEVLPFGGAWLADLKKSFPISHFSAYNIKYEKLTNEKAMNEKWKGEKWKVGNDK